MTDESDDGAPGERRPAAGQPGLGLFELISSVLAAAFGVQSSGNHARDFSRGSAGQFIVVGLVATVVFVLAVYGVVRLILHLAAG